MDPELPDKELEDHSHAYATVSGGSCRAARHTRRGPFSCTQEAWPAASLGATTRFHDVGSHHPRATSFIDVGSLDVRPLDDQHTTFHTGTFHGARRCLSALARRYQTEICLFSIA